MVILAIKLMLAHIIGDFILQPKHWVDDKTENKSKSKFLYYHVFVHAMLLLVAFQLDIKYWLGYVFIVVTHLIIDIIKTTTQTEKNRINLFFLDQTAHVLVIVLVVLFYEGSMVEFLKIFTVKSQLFLIAIFSVTKVTSVFIDVIISKWEIKNETGEKSLKDAGKYIGILERLLIFFFIVIGHWEGVGFLLAAKSIFRFGDLTKADDRKLTEYILIGTLLSFGFAMLISQLYVSVRGVL